MSHKQNQEGTEPMGQIHDRHFPGENAAYRAARDELLTAEMALRHLKTS